MLPESKVIFNIDNRVEEWGGPRGRSGISLNVCTSLSGDGQFRGLYVGRILNDVFRSSAVWQLMDVETSSSARHVAALMSEQPSLLLFRANKVADTNTQS